MGVVLAGVSVWWSVLCGPRATHPRLFDVELGSTRWASDGYPRLFGVASLRAGEASPATTLTSHFTAGRSLFQQLAAMRQIPSRCQVCTNFTAFGHGGAVGLLKRQPCSGPISTAISPDSSTRTVSRRRFWYPASPQPCAASTRSASGPCTAWHIAAPSASPSAVNRAAA